jgi:hypothetical protein
MKTATLLVMGVIVLSFATVLLRTAPPYSSIQLPKSAGWKKGYAAATVPKTCGAECRCSGTRCWSEPYLSGWGSNPLGAVNGSGEICASYTLA